MKKGSFAHAYFFFITAFEEMAASYYIMVNYENPKPTMLHHKEFLRHLKKYAFSRFYTFLLTGNYEYIHDYVETVRIFIENNNQNIEKKINKLL